MRYVIGLALAGLVATPALAVGRLADVTVIDRETGQHLTAHYHGGEYWVAGRPGAHYSIHIQSRDGRRLLAVTSVDGVNVLTGEDAGHRQRGYVFEPWQGYDIAGWRKTSTEIAAFTFTSVPRSYAARTGRPGNVGVIGVALFAERQHPRISAVAPPPPAPTRPYDERSSELAEVEVAGTRIQDSAQAESKVQQAPAAPPPANASANVQREEAQSRGVPPGLGTGHGRREYSQVHTVQFDRAGAAPDEVIRIRYDSRDNLVAMGVLHRPPPGPSRVDPFPQSPHRGYVPDP